MTETATKLDEAALRKPDFRGGEPITLEDGQDWAFPKPCLVYRPHFAGMVRGRQTTDLGPEFEAALDELDELGRERGEGEPEPARNFIDALFRLAVALLRINYELTDEKLVDLLAYRPDDEASRETWTAIVDVARGRGPKARGGGTGSPS